MRYLDREGVWSIPNSEGQGYEILVPGNSSAPDASVLALAGRVLPELPSLRIRALAYIEEFVARPAESESGEWHFEGLDFGYPEKLDAGRFRLSFSNSGDTYGEWSVVFQESESRYFPVRFSRSAM